MICAVTGAFGYSGKRITARLLASGAEVRTLTNSPRRPNAFGDQVRVFPYNFDRYSELVRSLEGVEVFINTYWVRFNQRAFTHDEAVRNTLVLFRAAKDAGVGRVVHVSITNPSEDSPFEYFRGKARLESALRDSGLRHSILRPAVLFGGEDILINNMAYLLRRLPVFAIAGSGEYRLQPIHVDDFADLAMAESRASGDRVIDAIGPETFAFRELVDLLNTILGTRRRIVHLPASLVALGGKLLGAFLGDVLITPEEVGGLMADLLHTDSPPAGKIVLSEWARENAATLGLKYHSEMARRRDRETAYEEL